MTSPSSFSFSSDRGRILPPDLDDRTWQDIVDEMRALIPRYTPAWTDHNPSDIGIALIELFAWLGEGIIYRLNRVPEKNYIAFLNLLGITRDPPSPARTYLTFTAGAAPVVVPAGTQAMTPAPEGRARVVFETDEDVRVLPTRLANVLAVGPYAAGATASRYRDATAGLVGPPAAKQLVTLPPGQSVQVCLGFEAATAEPVELGVRLYLPVPAPEPVAPPNPPKPPLVTASWVYSQDGGEPLAWPAVPNQNVQDGTASLQHDGGVRLSVPADWASARPSPVPGAPAGSPAATGWATVTAAPGEAGVTERRFWLGLRLTNTTGTGNTTAADVPIGVERILFNAAAARTALTIRAPESLGESTGAPFQTFPLKNRPLYRRPGLQAPYADLVVQVGRGTPTAWTTWTRVDDLPPGPGTVYRLDPVTGEIGFGNYDETRRTGHGSVPPPGSAIRALTYRHVASGAAGNVAPAQVSVLGTTKAGAMPTGVAKVTNLGPGFDGADEEPIEATLRRAPEELKIRDRAVTADDYEFLAREAVRTDVLITRCLTPRLQTDAGPVSPSGPAWAKGDPWTFAGLVRAPGTVHLVVVPDQGPSVARPEPTPELIRDVLGYLDQRRDLTVHLSAVGPRYLPIIVQAKLVVWRQALDAGADQNAVQADTLRRINDFLHPTRGGPAGRGWQVGQPVFTSDLFRAIMPPTDIGYISSLLIKPDIPAYHFPPLNPGGTAANYNATVERPFGLDPFGASVRVADYELVCSAGKHELQTLVVADG